MSTLLSATRRAVMAGTLGVAMVAGLPAMAQDLPENIHFIVPGGAGGGWDGTARGTGEALTRSGLLESASYENLSGGGGGVAIAHLIETADQQHDTLMVNSTPIVLRSLTGVFPQSFRDLTPIAAIIADYAAFVVPADSPYETFDDVVAAYAEDPSSIKVAGGSVRGGMDHLVPALAFQAAGHNPLDVAYVAYDAGGDALTGLLSGETDMLSTGLGEVLAQHEAGTLRILAITAEERIDDAPDIPTLVELGYDATFANWRGFFGAPGLPEERADAYAAMLGEMYDTPEWEEVRSRNGWQNLYIPRAAFVEFLTDQEAEMEDMLRQLGVI